MHIWSVAQFQSSTLGGCSSKPTQSRWLELTRGAFRIKDLLWNLYFSFLSRFFVHLAHWTTIILCTYWKSSFFLYIMSLSDLTKTASSKILKFWLSKSILYVKNHPNLSKNISLNNIILCALFLLLTFFDHVIFLKCAQFLLALLIILVGLTMTWYIEKIMISTK